MAHRAVPPFVPLHIVTDSLYVINALTKWLPKWEERGWICIRNANALQDMVAHLRSRSAVTTLRWVKGHSGSKGNEEADLLAKKGADAPRPFLPIALPAPDRFLKKGAELKALTQKLAYQAINMRRTKESVQRETPLLHEALEYLGHVAARKHNVDEFWTAIRKDPISKKARDFLWKTVLNAHKAGSYWKHIPGYEDRATCAVCGTLDSLTHILTECTAPGAKELWSLARNMLSPLGLNLPDAPQMASYISAPLIAVVRQNEKENTAKSRLARLVLTETMHLVWKTRCERVISWQTTPGRVHTVPELKRRWINVLNKRLWEDQVRAMRAASKRKSKLMKRVQATWCGTLQNEQDLPEDWVGQLGVLVGMPDQRRSGTGSPTLRP
ncbi:RnaseH-domain-containing protein [Cubamyces sp. BRFM 1775]|nr:RnaseH-domain-containing protein [Cubamyces sp. BRFM 1775]